MHATGRAGYRSGTRRKEWKLSTEKQFRPRAPRAAFTEEEWSALERDGAALEALAAGLRTPEGEAERRFLEVLRGEVAPETPAEHAWLRYRLVRRTPLTVELVPRTAWFDNVRSAVSATVWRRLARETARAAGERCEVCGGRGSRHPTECHEVWEYDDRRRVQRLAGVQALCPACHRAKHLGLALTRGWYPGTLRHLARVNGWSAADAEAYAEVVFEEWARRSQHPWTLDLSWLVEVAGVDPGAITRPAGE